MTKSAHSTPAKTVLRDRTWGRRHSFDSRASRTGYLNNAKRRKIFAPQVFSKGELLGTYVSLAGRHLGLDVFLQTSHPVAEDIVKILRNLERKDRTEGKHQKVLNHALTA